MMPNDHFTIVCTRNHRRVQRCKCGKVCTKLCDFEIKVGDVGHKRTCDEPLCDSCATRVGPNFDYCIPHAKLATKNDKEKAKTDL